MSPIESNFFSCLVSTYTQESQETGILQYFVPFLSVDKQKEIQPHEI